MTERSSSRSRGVAFIETSLVIAVVLILILGVAYIGRTAYLKSCVGASLNAGLQYVQQTPEVYTNLTLPRDNPANIPLIRAARTAIIDHLKADKKTGLYSTCGLERTTYGVWTIKDSNFGAGSDDTGREIGIFLEGEQGVITFSDNSTDTFTRPASGVVGINPTVVLVARAEFPIIGGMYKSKGAVQVAGLVKGIAFTSATVTTGTSTGSPPTTTGATTGGTGSGTTGTGTAGGTGGSGSGTGTTDTTSTGGTTGTGTSTAGTTTSTGTTTGTGTGTTGTGTAGTTTGTGATTTGGTTTAGTTTGGGTTTVGGTGTGTGTTTGPIACKPGDPCDSQGCGGGLNPMLCMTGYPIGINPGCGALPGDANTSSCGTNGTQLVCDYAGLGHCLLACFVRSCCGNGVCDTPFERNNCYADCGCPDGYIDLNGICYPNFSCTQNSDCLQANPPDGTTRICCDGECRIMCNYSTSQGCTRCTGDPCQAPVTDPDGTSCTVGSETGTCVGGECVKHCTDTPDCPECQMCDVATGDCIPFNEGNDCIVDTGGPTQNCPGSCVNGECTANQAQINACHGLGNTCAGDGSCASGCCDCAKDSNGVCNGLSTGSCGTPGSSHNCPGPACNPINGGSDCAPGESCCFNPNTNSYGCCQPEGRACGSDADCATIATGGSSLPLNCCSVPGSSANYCSSSPCPPDPPADCEPISSCNNCCGSCPGVRPTQVGNAVVVQVCVVDQLPGPSCVGVTCPTPVPTISPTISATIAPPMGPCVSGTQCYITCPVAPAACCVACID